MPTACSPSTTVWADAPDTVGRLRQFVLDLAVRGKLVEQDPADEPASELLQRIAAEKARMVATGRVRRSRKLQNGDPVPRFGLPASWVWSAIESVAHIEMGQSPRSEHYNRVGNGLAFFQGKADFGPRHPTPRYWCTKPTKIAEPDDILLSVRAPVGPTNVADQRCCIGRGLAALRPLEGLNRDFMLLALKAFESDLASLGFGTTFVAITKKQLTRYGFPLPPLAEQRRIVAKVDEIMALCDRMEETHAAREHTRDRLTKASYARLSDTETDASTFRSHARFAVDALPALTARADQVKQLRQTILNLAFRGKLVQQDPREGSGRDVHGRVSRTDPSPSPTGSSSKAIDGMHPLPSSWTWASLGQVIIAGPRNGLSPRASTRKGAPRAITLTATTSGVFDGSHFKRVDADIGPDSEYWLQPNDLLFQRGNTPEYVGMAAIYDGPPGEFIFPDLMIRVRLSPEVDLSFVHRFCVSPAARNYFSKNATGAQKTMPKINQAVLRALPIPLPPLSEQHRIVARLEKLIALCDRMEAGLGTADGTRSRLLESLLQHGMGSHDTAAADRNRT